MVLTPPLTALASGGTMCQKTEARIWPDRNRRVPGGTRVRHGGCNGRAFPPRWPRIAGYRDICICARQVRLASKTIDGLAEPRSLDSAVNGCEHEHIPFVDIAAAIIGLVGAGWTWAASLYRWQSKERSRSFTARPSCGVWA